MLFNFFYSLYLPDHQQDWTSCMFICHMCFLLCKLPVPSTTRYSGGLRCFFGFFCFFFFLVALQGFFRYYENKSFAYTYIANIFTQVVICLLTWEWPHVVPPGSQFFWGQEIGMEGKGVGIKRKGDLSNLTPILFPKCALRTFCNISTGHPFISLFLSPIGNSIRAVARRLLNFYFTIFFFKPEFYGTWGGEE